MTAGSVQGTELNEETNIVQSSLQRRSRSVTVDDSGQDTSWQECV